jgi:DNA-binding NtrC family response regulator
MAKNRNVMMLAGANGVSFFLHEALLGYGLVDRVDTVSSTDEAINLIRESEPFSLVVINLGESWEQGMELGFWLKQQPASCPVILITPTEPVGSLPLIGAPFILLPAPLSLDDFIRTVRAALPEKAVSQKRGRSGAWSHKSWSRKP